MTQYVLNVMQPEGTPPPPEVLDEIMKNLANLNAEMKAAGVWVFTAGLAAPSSATVLRAKDDEVLITDGPYLEGKEYVGGFTIIEAADLDAALDWGRKLAVITRLPIEVRPVFG